MHTTMSERPMRFHNDETLPEHGEVLVFESNTLGRHSTGTALVAVRKFGAKLGVAAGPMGCAYAIVTHDNRSKPLPLADIARQIGGFLLHATQCPNTRFWVTRIGTGVDGLSEELVASYFVGAPDNCSFSEQWRTFLEPSPPTPDGPAFACAA